MQTPNTLQHAPQYALYVLQKPVLSRRASPVWQLLEVLDNPSQARRLAKFLSRLPETDAVRISVLMPGVGGVQTPVRTLATYRAVWPKQRDTLKRRVWYKWQRFLVRVLPKHLRA